VVAEDDDAMRALIVERLGRDGYDLAEVATGSELLDLLSQERLDGRPGSAFDLIVTDVRMPGRNGLDAIAFLRRAGSTTPVIAVAAFPDDEVRARAKSLRAMLLAKPYALKALRGAVRYCLGLHQRAPDPVAIKTCHDRLSACAVPASDRRAQLIVPRTEGDERASSESETVSR
jgi:CheY-like chemotaxis protein